MRARVLAIAIALAISPLSLAAEAEGEGEDEEEPTPGEMAEARVHFERALEHEEDGDYEASADEYLTAYSLYPDPEFFFNAARVLREGGDFERSLRYYERYLELDPDGRGADAANEQVEALRERIDAEDEEPEEDAPEEEAETAAPAAPGPLDPGDPDAEVGTSADGTAGGMRTAGVITGAAGLVALGTSAYFGNRARTLGNDISAFLDDNPGQWDDDILAKYDRGERADRAMLIFGGVGLAAVGAGAALYLMADGGGDDAGGVAIAPSLTPGGAGIAVGGSF